MIDEAKNQASQAYQAVKEKAEPAIQQAKEKA